MDFVHPIHDNRISHHYADLNGKKYHYLLAIPPRGYKATIFLIHGWPDLAIGWRYQIPLLLELGYRVVCPDIMGFGGTDAPKVPPESISFYSYKRAANDIKELARQLRAPKIILGGHDWGGAVVYRVALWHPELVTNIFAVCTPYTAPASSLLPLESIVKKLPNFGYQIQLASGIVEEHIQTREEIKKLLNALYGGKVLNGGFGFEVTKGVVFENLEKLKKTDLMSEEMLEYYTDQYARNGMHGTLSWYRSREQNFQDELQLENKTISIPVLFIQAINDRALPLAMSEGMEQYMPKLTRGLVATSHWALWEAPEQVNDLIKKWLERVDKTRSTL